MGELRHGRMHPAPQPRASFLYQNWFSASVRTNGDQLPIVYEVRMPERKSPPTIQAGPDICIALDQIKNCTISNPSICPHRSSDALLESPHDQSHLRTPVLGTRTHPSRRSTRTPYSRTLRTERDGQPWSKKDNFRPQGVPASRPPSGRGGQRARAKRLFQSLPTGGARCQRPPASGLSLPRNCVGRNGGRSTRKPESSR